jgi:hypothetical protein
MRRVTGLERLDTAVAARAWSAEVVCRWLSARPVNIHTPRCLLCCILQHFTICGWRHICCIAEHAVQKWRRSNLLQNGSALDDMPPQTVPRACICIALPASVRIDQRIQTLIL